MKLTIMKRVRKIMVIATETDITLIGYESVKIYQKIIMSNIEIERLVIKETLVARQVKY